MKHLKYRYRYITIGMCVLYYMYDKKTALMGTVTCDVSTALSSKITVDDSLCCDSICVTNQIVLCGWKVTAL